MGAAKKAARVRSRSKLSRAENATHKRRRILEAALEEFALRGFGAARMEDVARRAGVGKGTLYLYFDDKESLFEGLVHEFILPPLAALREVQRRPGESVGDAMRRVMPTAIARAAGTRVGDLLRLLIGTERLDILHAHRLGPNQLPEILLVPVAEIHVAQ